MCRNLIRTVDVLHRVHACNSSSYTMRFFLLCSSPPSPSPSLFQVCLVMPVVIVYVSTPKAPRYLCSCKFTIDREERSRFFDDSRSRAHTRIWVERWELEKKMCWSRWQPRAPIAHRSDQFISSRNVISQECSPSSLFLSLSAFP